MRNEKCHNLGPFTQQATDDDVEGEVFNPSSYLTLKSVINALTFCPHAQWRSESKWHAGHNTIPPLYGIISGLACVNGAQVVVGRGVLVVKARLKA
ncbi:hypothetical protein AVEN_232689-1 [Araneus ventricosus]|uniref:Uncharacterized protein n=1 Tax=Araneus ventricosus TaxID=182803 RepID=A0A4Y2VY34_ARAVE|nr:hypothetical protein AVEN_232689-1 [Araneus ventricosus]